MERATRILVRTSKDIGPSTRRLEIQGSGGGLEEGGSGGAKESPSVDLDRVIDGGEVLEGEYVE